MPTRKEIRAKQTEIKTWWATCDITNPFHRQALLRAARMLYARQTADEQATHTTRNLNGRGFNGRDAEFGSRLAKWEGDLTLKAASGARSMLKKYSRQIAEMSLGMP